MASSSFSSSILSTSSVSDSCVPFSSSSPSTACSVPPSPSRFPTLFISHGGGPCFFMDASGSESLFSSIDKNSAAASWYRQLSTQMGLVEGGRYGKPKAIVVLSAHWETGNNAISVTSQEKHSGLYYDYYGFPNYTYSIQYPAPGSPSLSSRIIDLLKGKKISASADTKRNFDHGVFIPLKLIYPNAHIPIVQVSINNNLDPSYHMRIGEALAPLREEGILIIGSGQSTHDLSFRVTSKEAEKFIDAVNKVVVNDKLSSNERIDQLKNWTKFPYARTCHPREEHFIPFFCAVGAAEGAVGKALQKKQFLFEGIFEGMSLQSWAFDYNE